MASITISRGTPFSAASWVMAVTNSLFMNGLPSARSWSFAWALQQKKWGLPTSTSVGTDGAASSRATRSISGDPRRASSLTIAQNATLDRHKFIEHAGEGDLPMVGLPSRRTFLKFFSFGTYAALLGACAQPLQPAPPAPAAAPPPLRDGAASRASRDIGGGCRAAAATAPAAAAPAAAPAAQTGQVVNLKLQTLEGATGMFHKQAIDLSQKLDEMSGGRRQGRRARRRRRRRRLRHDRRRPPGRAGCRARRAGLLVRQDQGVQPVRHRRAAGHGRVDDAGLDALRRRQPAVRRAARKPEAERRVVLRRADGVAAARLVQGRDQVGRAVPRA